MNLPSCMNKPKNVYLPEHVQIQPCGGSRLDVRTHLAWRSVRHLLRSLVFVILAAVTVDLSAQDVPVNEIAYLKGTEYDQPGIFSQVTSFGYSVDIDGDMAAIGCLGHGRFDASGEFWFGRSVISIFSNSGASWQHQADLFPTSSETAAERADLGFSVAISGDHVITGDPWYSDIGDPDTYSGAHHQWAGAAWVFRRTPSGWVQDGFLQASDADEYDRFGWSVDIDGDVAVVGAYLQGPEPDDEPGAAYVFRRIGGSWEQVQKLKATHADDRDRFGWSVAIDMPRIVVGARDERSTSLTDPTVNSELRWIGAAYVFEPGTDGIWRETNYLKPSNAGEVAASIMEFGSAVAVAGDTIVVGATGEGSTATGVNGDQTNQDYPGNGAAYVFEKQEDWTQTAYLKSNFPWFANEFGNSVAVAGEHIAVGAFSYADDPDRPNPLARPGAVFGFKKEGSRWTGPEFFQPSYPGTLDSFGNSVAVSDAGAILAGAPGESSPSRGSASDPSEDSDRSEGAAYIFAMASSTGPSLGEITVEHPPGTGLVDGASTIDFGGAAPGGVTVAKTITASNEGVGELLGLAVAFDGASAGDFSVDTAGMATVLAPGASTTFTVTFAPAELGARIAQLRIISDDTDENPFDIVMVGTGVVPMGEVRVENPAGTEFIDGVSSIDFGSGDLGVPIGAETITIFNDGPGELAGLAVRLDGAAAGDFSVDTTGVAPSLAPGASATFTVTFTPGAVGSRTAQLYVDSDDADENPFDIALTGTGYLPEGEIRVEGTPGTGLVDGVSSIDFGSGTPGLANDTKTITIFNDGNGELGGLAVTVDGAAAGDFSVDTDGMATALAPGASTTFTVSFTPGALGLRAAQLQINSSDTDESPFDISLVGTGVAPSDEVLLVGWGRNHSGQLGDGTTTNRSSPALVDQRGVLAGRTVVALAAGNAHTVVLCSDGTLASWGDNEFGQLGDGTTTTRSRPVLVNQSGVLAGKAVVALAAGALHTVALCSDGTLASWGINEIGSLGDGTTTNRSRPVLVDQNGVLAGKTVVAIAAGAFHTLTLCSDGTIASWGFNFYGQLGDGTGTNRSRPVLVNQSGVLAGKTVVALAAGGNHTVALCSDGTLASWGFNDFGQLGDGTTTDQEDPVLVDQSGVLAGRTVEALAAGGIHTLALCSDGTLASWGYNSFGQLGDGTTDRRNRPVLVDQSGVLAARTIVAVGAGGLHSVALCSDGVIASWGDNDFGQLGTGTGGDQSNPVRVDQSGVLSLNGRKVESLAVGRDSVLTLAARSASPFDIAAAAAGLSGPDAGPLATPFGDGVANLVKFAFNMSLSGPDHFSMPPGGTGGLPHSSIVEDEFGKRWRIEYVRHIGSGLIYTPEKSISLKTGSFVPVPIGGSATETVQPIDPHWERVIVEDPLPLELPPRIYWRIRIE